MADYRRRHDDARREMLQAIRERLAASAPFDGVRNEHGTHHAVVTRSDQPTTIVQTPGSLTERFRLALEAVSGQCLVVSDEAEAATVLERIIVKKKATRVAISDSSLVRRVTQNMGAGVELLEFASQSALFGCDAGITSAQWAIAETGTLVLESESERHRLASLVPPVHIALIQAGAIRDTMADVLHSLNQHGQNGLSPAVTFITGPSRTSDIELTLAIGVHGPGELYVIVIEAE